MLYVARGFSRLHCTRLTFVIVPLCGTLPTKNMAEEVPVAKGPKEADTLNHTSMVTLARGLGKEKDGLTLIMLLNIPTITIVNIIYQTDKDGLLNDESGALLTEVMQKGLLLWRDFTKEQKNKDRMKTLEKALREMGKNELADAIMEKFQNHLEITADLFA